ncbi:WYL domain-containing protein [Streptosporangium sp. NPDC023963]|uniref:WYL domain-containing protein n=1 Tax=Streptosporangium sp. NPDC023963 TaxID=3155608 RepID=UPI003433DE99
MPARRGSRRIEPHHLVIWAGRWYLVSWDVADGNRRPGTPSGTANSGTAKRIGP